MLGRVKNDLCKLSEDCPVTEKKPSDWLNQASITRYKELKTAWKELDTEEVRYNDDRRRLSILWNDWLKTFEAKGPSTLDTAAGHFDITTPDSRTTLEINFASACLGPSSCSLSAKALSEAIDPDKQGTGKPCLGGKREKVIWTSSDFDVHSGTRISKESETAVYRRVYHVDREGRALNSISGKLTYSPLEGLSLPPIDIKEIAWI
ncbi:hypothetical protein [Pseudomonas monsensis]|uniref:hypothetical protein n=1 Tax=Pseudomonas monsensis TaxID=2745509 RepID=UPI00300E8C9A